jgi:hypothetical protein
MLDAISEEINNNIYSKGHRAIGMSSRLAGSGVAFSYQLYKDTMSKLILLLRIENKFIKKRL